MRPNRLGKGILGFFLIGGIALWITKPESGVGQIWVATTVALGIMFVVMHRRAERADRMKETGTPGQAQILELTQTGMYVNEQPRVKLKLAIQAPGVAPFEDTKTHTVPLIALGRLSSGMPLAVYLSQEDPKDYVIDWFGAPGGTSSMTGPITVQTPAGGAVGIDGNPGAAQAVMKALSDHGIATTGGTIDLRHLPAARAAVLNPLQAHGIDAAHQVAAQDPNVPIEDQGEPMERLKKLDELRAANLVTPQEYETYRKRILEDV